MRHTWLTGAVAVVLPVWVRAFSALTRRRHVDYGRVAAEACRRSR
jgi:hypothetical protein